MEKFTVEEFKNYLLSQDSRGDIMYNLSAENIRKANICDADGSDKRSVEKCRHYDCAQGRNYCCNRKVNIPHCLGVCDEYEE